MKDLKTKPSITEIAIAFENEMFEKISKHFNESHEGIQAIGIVFQIIGRRLSSIHDTQTLVTLLDYATRDFRKEAPISDTCDADVIPIGSAKPSETH